MLDHQAMINRQIRLAFHAVNNQRVKRRAFWRRKLNVRRKRRAAHADNARLFNPVKQFFRRKSVPRHVFVPIARRGRLRVLDDD